MCSKLWMTTLAWLLGGLLFSAGRGDAQNKGAAQRTRPPAHILLVGVSDYTHPDDPKSLPNLNCNEDVDALAKVFQTHFAVPSGNIAMLKTKQETTRKAIVDAFHRLIEQTRPGDVVFFHYSGRGTLIRTAQKPDQTEQALVVSDYVSFSDHSNDIRLSEIARLLLELKAKHPGSVVLSIDACNANGLQPEKPGTVHVNSQKALGLGIDGRHGFVVLAAAGKNQEAFETKTEDGKEMGLFSYALAKALSTAGPQSTYRDLCEYAASIMRRHTQTPEIQGDADTAVLDTRVLTSEAYLPLLIDGNGEGKDAFFLPAGSLQNMSVGSRFTLYPRGTKAFDRATPLAQAEVTMVAAAVSRLKLLSPNADKITSQQLMAAHAVESQHKYMTRLSVDLRALTAKPKFASLLNDIRRIVFVREVSKPDEKADIRLLLAQGDGALRLERADGTLLTSTDGAKYSLAEIENALQQELRWQFLRKLKTPGINGKNVVSRDIEMRLIPVVVQSNEQAQMGRRDASRALCAQDAAKGEASKEESQTAIPLLVTGEKNLARGEDGIPQLAKGDRVMIEVWSSGEGYINIINLSSNGRLSPIWPHPDLALRDNYSSRGKWQRLPFILEITEPYGLESLKAILTSKPTDFSYLLNMRPMGRVLDGNQVAQGETEDNVFAHRHNSRCSALTNVDVDYWDVCAVDYRVVPTTGRLHVLAVGAGSKAGDATGLGLAPTDAQAVAEGLETRGKAWYRKVFTHLLVGKDATREGVQKAFEQIAAQARPQDTFIFYYAGAQTLVPRAAGGAPELLLTPQEIKADEDAAARGIPSRLLRTWTGRIMAQKQVLLLDTCSPDRPFTAFVDQVTAEDPDLKDLLLRQMVVMGSVGQRVLFRGKHGPLAEALLHGLSGEAATPATDNSADNQIMASDLESYLKGKLLEVSERKLRLNSKFIGEDFPVEPAPAARRSKPAGALRTVALVSAPAEEAAAEYTRNGKDYALLIGTNSYDHADALKNPLNDVRAVDETLRTVYGFQTEVLEDKSRKEIMDALRRYCERKDFAPDDQLLIYIAGHGSYDEISKGKIICRDSPEDTSFDDSTVITYPTLCIRVNAIRCQHILLVLDVCYGGSLFETTREAKMGKKAEADISRSDLLKSVMSKKTRLALTSGNKEPVPDGGGNHSPFTYRFLQALTTMEGKTGILRASTGLLQQVQTARPQPVWGYWGDNQPGSDFLFIAGPK